LHPHAKCQLFRCRNVDYSPQTIKVWILPINLLRELNCLHDFYEIFSVYAGLLRAAVFSVWLLLVDKQTSCERLPRWGHFFHKFSIAISGKTADRIRKSWRCKSWTDILYCRENFGGELD